MLKPVNFKSRVLKEVVLKKIALQKAILGQFSSKEMTSNEPARQRLTEASKSIQTEKQHSGQAAENLANAYLLNQGLIFLERNYHCRHGEIDLIFKDNDSVVFIEVRFRRQITFGTACETIDSKKQKKIIKTAEYYLHMHRLTESVISRLDVIGITPSKNYSKKSAVKVHNDRMIINDDYCKEYSIEWIKDAFQAF